MPVNIGPEKRKHPRSIDAFCERVGIARATFYNYRDTMPHVTKVGARSIITELSEQEWNLRSAQQDSAA
ncbi:MAG: hypothetical protein NVSMB15_14990 [Steroidobacteraceae bacterium]